MNFIWTNHALARLKDRKISQGFAEQILQKPDNIFDQKDSIKYEKKIDDQIATAIIKKNELGESIVVSFWVDPPNQGTKDYKNYTRRKEMLKASPLKKILITLLNQLGL